MNAQDPSNSMDALFFLSGPGADLGREVAITLGNAGVTPIPDGSNPGRFETPGPVFGKSCIELCHGRGVDGGRRMDGLVG